MVGEVFGLVWHKVGMSLHINFTVEKSTCCANEYVLLKCEPTA